MYISSLFFVILEHDMQNYCISMRLFWHFLAKICEFFRLFSIFTGVAFGRDDPVFLLLAGVNCCTKQLLKPSKPMLIGDLRGSGEVFVSEVVGLCPPRSL